MTYTCRQCWRPFTRQQRAQGACPHCGAVFETAELVALCCGLASSFLLVLVLPELARLAAGEPWRPPSDTAVLLRAGVTGAVLVGGLLLLSAKYALWQGAALRAHPGLRLLWLVAFPGLLYATVVLAVGVAVDSLRQHRSPRRTLQHVLHER